MPGADNLASGEVPLGATKQYVEHVTCHGTICTDS